MSTEPARHDDASRTSQTRWLLINPFVAVLWVPLYNGIEPTLWSVPLFYWYQLLWVLLCTVIVAIVYRAERP